MKKFLAIFLVFLMSVAMVGCDKCSPTQSTDETPVVYEKIKIVTDNSSEFSIVKSVDASLTESRSATELSDKIYQATGVKIPILTDDGMTYDTGKKYISIGKTVFLNGANLNYDYDTLNGDGFFIKFIGNLILIDGKTDRARMYGVYDFLEKFVGVRYLTLETTYVPEKSEVVVEKKDILEIPDFYMRNYLSYDNTYYPELSSKMRMVNDIIYTSPELGGEGPWYDGQNHNTLWYISPDQYPNNPEMFSGNKSELCFSNGMNEDGTIDWTKSVSVPVLIFEKLKAMATEKPDKEFFMIGQMDSPAKECECSECLENLKKYGTRAGLQLVMINELAREFKAWGEENFPGRNLNLVMFAYNYSQQPPIKDDKPVNDLVVPEENVYIRIAPFLYDYGTPVNHPNQSEVLKELYRGWSLIADNLMVWDYMLNTAEIFWYTPYIGVLKENYKFYKSIGVKYIMNQAGTVESNDFQDHINLYIASKLMWDIDADVDALLEEFLTLEYGMVANDVREYIDYMEDFYAMTYVKYPEFEVQPDLSLNAAYGSVMTYPYEMMKYGLDIMENAIVKVENSDLGAEEKAALLKKLKRARLKPQRMLMKFMDSYPMTNEEKQALTREFITSAEELNVQFYAFDKSLDSLKATYGFE